MGNSSSSAFDSGEAIAYTGNGHWTLNQGSRKNLDDKEEVAIFKFLKTQKDKLIPAQRAIQKMKTLKHPHILSYIESAEYEDSLVLVTEGCVPLQVWLQTAAKNNQNEESRHQELLWGLKCVLETLQFLHNNGLVHSYLGLHAIFVAKSGDWKIGALDLLGNMTLEDDFNFLKSYASILARPYIAPERQQPLVFVSEAEKTSKVAVGSGADIFSLAHCIETCYATADLTVPEGLSKYFTRMLSIDPKRRPTASQLIKCPVFSSDNIKLMATLGDLAALKPANETLEALGQLSEKVPILPISICIHKILPSLSRTLQMACTDFNNRDARESCRQSIQLCLSMLSRLAENEKIDEEHYSKQCLPAVLALWTMTDRTIRTALLGSLKNLVALTPADMVNKSMFDPLLAGFADSNAKMREETLKCLVHVVDKLDEKHLQEKLVRCIINLQNDTENSIRTNATIFLGRTAVKLKEGVRVRVLCTSFAKAMRDGFVHCRVAGLKAAIACLPLLDHGQLTSKVLPQACSLMLDRSAEVRELAMKLLEQGVALMKQQHKKLCAVEKKAAAAQAAGGDGGKAPEKDLSSWAPTWSSLSLTLEKMAVGGASTTQSTTAAPTDTGSSTPPPETATTPSPVVVDVESSDVRNSRAVSLVPKVAVVEGWGGDGDFDDWDDTNSSAANGGNASSTNSNSGGGGGWGDDDDLNVEDSDNEDSPPSNSSSGSAVSTPIKVPKGMAPAALSKAPIVKLEVVKKPEVTTPKAKKLPISTGPSKRLDVGADSSDNWDDF